jgi:hypothetical protein
VALLMLNSFRKVSRELSKQTGQFGYKIDICLEQFLVRVLQTFIIDYIYSYIYSYIYDYIMSSSNTPSIVAFDPSSDVSYQTSGSPTRYRSFVQISIYVNLPQPIDFLVKNEPDMSFEDSVLVEQHEFIFSNANGAKKSFQSFIFEYISNIDVIDTDNLFDF